MDLQEQNGMGLFSVKWGRGGSIIGESLDLIMELLESLLSSLFDPYGTSVPKITSKPQIWSVVVSILLLLVSSIEFEETQ